MSSETYAKALQNGVISPSVFKQMNFDDRFAYIEGLAADVRKYREDIKSGPAEHAAAREYEMKTSRIMEIVREAEKDPQSSIKLIGFALRLEMDNGFVEANGNDL